MPTPEQVLEALKTVKFPGLSRDIVSFGFVRDVEVSGGRVAFTVHFQTENPTVGAGARTFPVAAAAATTSSAFPPRVGVSVSGWMFLELDNRAGVSASSPFSVARPSQNWIVIKMQAEGRYGVEYDATALGNGCTNPLQQGGVAK